MEYTKERENIMTVPNTTQYRVIDTATGAVHAGIYGFAHEARAEARRLNDACNPGYKTYRPIKLQQIAE